MVPSSDKLWQAVLIFRIEILVEIVFLEDIQPS